MQMLMRNAVQTSLPARLVTILLWGLLVAVATACGGPQATAPPVGATAQLPGWLNRVYPSPGANTSATAAIQADFRLTGPDQRVRLLLDGTDVTTYATIQRGELHYDPDDGRSLVELDPGMHTATIELVTAPAYGQRQAVIDRYEWRFAVL